MKYGNNNNKIDLISQMTLEPSMLKLLNLNSAFPNSMWAYSLQMIVKNRETMLYRVPEQHLSM